MKIFGGSANKPLAEKTAKDLDLFLYPVDVHVFPDGERRIQIAENVVDAHTVVIQTANTPVDSNYMELFFIVDALKRSGAEYVVAVIPYFGYQRQDHVFRDGEAVSLEVMIKILETIGVNRVISVDMHSVKIPNLFHIPVCHLSALPLFSDEIRKQGWVTKDTILVSPDMGGIARIKKLSSLLGGMEYAAVEKERDLATGSITAEGFGEGNVKGKKRAILVDDMISSGNTIMKAASVLKESGIKELIVFATHAIFSKDAPTILQKSKIKKVYVSDTVLVPNTKQFKKLKILSMSGIIASELRKSQER